MGAEGLQEVCVDEVQDLLVRKATKVIHTFTLPSGLGFGGDRLDGLVRVENGTL